MNGIHYSSNSGEWGTEAELFRALNDQFHFTVDLAANELNHKVDRYYSIRSSLLDHLGEIKKEVCWLNPVYGDPENICKPRCHKEKCVSRGYHIGEYQPGAYDFVEAAADLHHEPQSNTVVILIPARTDTALWHDLIMKHADEIWLLRGRLRFEMSRFSEPINSDDWPTASDGLPVIKPSEIRSYTLINEPGASKDPAPFPSAIVIMRPRPVYGHRGPIFSSVDPAHYIARHTPIPPNPYIVEGA